MQRKVIFLMIDGLGSLPVKGRRTELELAKTPNLDKLARNGACGLMHPIGTGIIPGSDTSQLNILGYPPEKFYPGRGPLEALGAGVRLEEGDVAFRANFATVDERFVVVDRRAGRIATRDASELAKSIASISIDGFEFTFKSTVEHRGVVVVRGKDTTGDVEDTDPHATGVPVRQPKITAHNAALVRAINKYTAEVHRRLSVHPLNRGRKLKANMVLLRGAGQFRAVEPFEKRYGMRACCIAGGALYKGIAHYLGMHVPIVQGATGDFNTDLNAKARAAVAHLKDYDFVYLHVKAMDSAGHDGDTKKRIEMLQRIDKIMPMLTKTEAVIFVSGDHSTPPTKREHSFEPVPILVGNVEARDYGVKKFCEVECAKGELGRITGADVMRLVLAYSGRAEKYGT